MEAQAAATQSPTLKITFRCMCFFVPDPRSGRMHVLMPDTTRGNGCHGRHEDDGHGVEPHVVRLDFPFPGGQIGVGADGKLAIVDPGEGFADFRELEKCTLVLSGDGSGAAMDLPDEVPNLSETNGPVSPGLLDPEDPRAITRVVLESGGVEDVDSPAFWTYQRHGKRELAQELVWRMPLGGNSLRWRLLRKDGSGQVVEEELPELFPNERNEVAINIQHITEPDFPAEREDAVPNVRAQHFRAFHVFFDDPQDCSVPRYEGIRHGRYVTCVEGQGRQA